MLNIKTLFFNEIIVKIKRMVLFNKEIQDRRVIFWTDVTFDQFHTWQMQKKQQLPIALSSWLTIKKIFHSVSLQRNTSTTGYAWYSVLILGVKRCFSALKFTRGPPYLNISSYLLQQTLIFAQNFNPNQSLPITRPTIPVFFIFYTPSMVRNSGILFIHSTSTSSSTPSTLSPIQPKVSRTSSQLSSIPSTVDAFFNMDVFSTSSRSGPRPRKLCYGSCEEGFFLWDCPQSDQYQRIFNILWILPMLSHTYYLTQTPILTNLVTKWLLTLWILKTPSSRKQH